MMEVKISEELSANAIEDLIKAKFPGYTATADYRSSATVERTVYPSITTPGTLLRSKLDDADILVVPTEQEIEAAVRHSGLPMPGPGHHRLRVLAEASWISLCEADTTVIGWMDPTK